MRDPQPYDGPIERSDGIRPFNGYLWPTEQWLAREELDDRYLDFDWRIEIVALADGRYSCSGVVREIEAGHDLGRRCVFPDRAGAIRASAASMIRLARKLRSIDYLRARVGWRAKDLPVVVAWAREVVSRETGAAPPRPIALRVPAPPRASTGMPLLDLMVQP